MNSGSVADPSDLAAQVAAYPRGRVPGALRRKQILAEACQLFLERGYHRASMDELARRVGVTKPVVYNLAGSKEELFREVMAAVNAELATVLIAAAGAEETLERKLRAGIAAFLEFARERRQAWLALLAAEQGPATGEVAEMRRRQATIVAALLAQHVDIADPRLAHALGLAVNGAVEFVASWWLEHQDISADAVADLLTRTLAHGLLAQTGAGA